jgi:hypothetical protein
MVDNSDITPFWVTTWLTVTLPRIDGIRSGGRSATFDLRANTSERHEETEEDAPKQTGKEYGEKSFES